MTEHTHLLLQFACSLVTQSKVRKQFPLYSTISICIPLLNTAGFFGQIRFFLFCYVGSSQCSAVTVLGTLRFRDRISWPSAAQQLAWGQASQQTLLGKAGARPGLYIAVQGHYYPWVFLHHSTLLICLNLTNLVWTLPSISALLSATSWVCCSQ